MKVSEINKKIGRKVGVIRVERKMTQEQLALEAGLNRAYIGYIERGERSPTVKTLNKIAKVLNVDLAELFEK